MARDFKLEQEIEKKANKAKEAEKEFFRNLTIEEKLKCFPLHKDKFEDNKTQEASAYITDIVYYILEKEGKIITLGKREYDNKKFLETNKDTEKSKQLKESLKQERNGKKITKYMYYREWFNTEELKDRENDMEECLENYDESKLDHRVDDAINQLNNLLFLEDTKIENFYEEYGDVNKYPKEFIAFIKQMLREEVYVDRIVQRHNMSIEKEEPILDIIIEKEEKKKNNEEEYNMILNFLKQNSEIINGCVLKEINNEYKKELTVFYYDYKNYVDSDIKLQPKSMKSLRLLSKYYDKTIVDIRKKDFGYLPPLEKKQQIQDILDPMNFWNQFFNKNKDYITKFESEYEKERGKKFGKNENISREKEKIIKQVNNIILNCLKKENNYIENKDAKETILSIVRRMFLKTGGYVTKKEIVTFSKNIRQQKSCKQYREYIYLDVTGSLDDKNEKATLEEHLKNCESCKKFKEDVSKGINYRKNRNKLLGVKQNPYLEMDVKTEEEYNNIKNEEYCYRELKKTKSPLFLNYYVLALIKNGKKKDAKEIMKNSKKFINENLML